MTRLLIATSNRLARACRWLAEFFEEADRRLDRCERCGRSKWYGKECVSEND